LSRLRRWNSASPVDRASSIMRMSVVANDWRLLRGIERVGWARAVVATGANVVAAYRKSRI
jgi:hypothetical protein